MYSYYSVFTKKDINRLFYSVISNWRDRDLSASRDTDVVIV